MSSVKDKKRVKNNDEQQSPISIIPDDLLVEIFIRLPHSRSATRCTAVCKRWRSLICHRQFRLKFTKHLSHEGGGGTVSSVTNPQNTPSHEQQFPYTTMLLLFDDKLFYQIFSHKSKALHGTAKQFSDSFRYLDFLRTYARPLACFQDLLLVSSPPSMEYLVCNPLSRRSQVLPAAPPSPTAGHTRHGIVFKPRSDQLQLSFKVVTLDRCRVTRDRRLAIFCSESGGWTQPSSLPPSVSAAVASFATSDAVATGDGVLHFPMRHRGGDIAGFLAVDPFDDDDQRRCSFTGFVVRREELPPATSFAGVVGGRLRVSQSFGSQIGVFDLKIWELDRDSAAAVGSWVSVHGGEVRVDPKARVISVTGFDPNNGDVMFVVDKCSEIYKYRLEDKEFETVGLIPPPTLAKCLSQPHMVFMRSLTLVHPTWPSLIPPLP